MVCWSCSRTSGIALRILGISQFSIFRARSGEVATTEAERSCCSSRPCSPKTSPGPISAIASPARSTRGRARLDRVEVVREAALLDDRLPVGELDEHRERSDLAELALVDVLEQVELLQAAWVHAFPPGGGVERKLSDPHAETRAWSDIFAWCERFSLSLSLLRRSPRLRGPRRLRGRRSSPAAAIDGRRHDPPGGRPGPQRRRRSRNRHADPAGERRPPRLRAEAQRRRGAAGRRPDRPLRRRRRRVDGSDRRELRLRCAGADADRRRSDDRDERRDRSRTGGRTPRNAILAVGSIRDRLAEIDPDGAPPTERNARAYVAAARAARRRDRQMHGPDPGRRPEARDQPRRARLLRAAATESR